MWSSRLLAAVALVAGCNQLLHLDAVATDRDGDGIADAVDNCVDVYNPDQADRDGDGVGDACSCHIGIDTDHDGIDDGCDPCIGPGETGMDTNGDGIDDGCEVCPTATFQDLDRDGIDDGCDTCLSGPPHDEDGDGVADACDVCPTVMDTDQTDTDGDGVGDACEPSLSNLGFNVQRLFNPFTEKRFSVWGATLQDGWSIHDDQLHVDGVHAGGDLLESSSRVDSTGFHVETRLSGLGDGDSAKRLGIAVSLPGSPTVRCTLDGAGFVHLEVLGNEDVSNVTVPSFTRVVLQLADTRSLVDGKQTLTCIATVDNMQVSASLGELTGFPLTPVGIYDHDVDGTFDYLWLITP